MFKQFLTAGLLGLSFITSGCMGHEMHHHAFLDMKVLNGVKGVATNDKDVVEVLQYSEDYRTDVIGYDDTILPQFKKGDEFVFDDYDVGSIYMICKTTTAIAKVVDLQYKNNAKSIGQKYKKLVQGKTCRYANSEIMRKFYKNHPKYKVIGALDTDNNYYVLYNPARKQNEYAVRINNFSSVYDYLYKHI